MSGDEKGAKQQKEETSRRGFVYNVVGGAVAAIAGWIAGTLSQGVTIGKDDLRQELDAMQDALTATKAQLGDTRQLKADVESKIATLSAQMAQVSNQLSTLESQRSLNEAETSELVSGISTLEAQVAGLGEELLEAKSRIQSLGECDGEQCERVVFHKNELSVINTRGGACLLNLVATDGGVGIRFYKDFYFGNEKVTNPWHMGWIEGSPKGYQGLAILRDWRFTAALWDEDGKLLLGRLDSHPPANPPAKARFQIRGTVDEVQAIVEASRGQAADIFQVVSGEGTKYLTVNSAGAVVVGSHDEPKEISFHDTVDGSAYSLKVTNGRLTLTRSL